MADPERIEILVVAPPTDFLKTGGIANAIQALTVLDTWLDKVNAKFQTLGLDTKSVGGAAGAAKELTAKIQAGVGTVRVPVEFVPKGGDLKVTRIFNAGNEEVARQIKSQMGPHGTSTLHEVMGEGGEFEQSKIVQVARISKPQPRPKPKLRPTQTPRVSELWRCAGGNEKSRRRPSVMSRLRDCARNGLPQEARFNMAHRQVCSWRLREPCASRRLRTWEF